MLSNETRAESLATRMIHKMAQTKENRAILFVPKTLSLSNIAAKELDIMLDHGSAKIEHVVGVYTPDVDREWIIDDCMYALRNA